MTAAVAVAVVAGGGRRSGESKLRHASTAWNRFEEQKRAGRQAEGNVERTMWAGAPAGERGSRNRARATTGDEADDDQSTTNPLRRTDAQKKKLMSSSSPLLSFAFFGSCPHRVGVGRVAHLFISARSSQPAMDPSWVWPCARVVCETPS